MCVEGSGNYDSVVEAGREYVLDCLVHDWWLRANSSAEAGYKALFLSVDVPVLGKRLNEYRNEFRIPEDMEYPNILSRGADTSDRTNYGMLL